MLHLKRKTARALRFMRKPLSAHSDSWDDQPSFKMVEGMVEKTKKRLERRMFVGFLAEAVTAKSLMNSSDYL